MVPVEQKSLHVLLSKLLLREKIAGNLWGLVRLWKSIWNNFEDGCWNETIHLK